MMLIISVFYHRVITGRWIFLGKKRMNMFFRFAKALRKKKSASLKGGAKNAYPKAEIVARVCVFLYLTDNIGLIFIRTW